MEKEGEKKKKRKSFYWNFLGVSNAPIIFARGAQIQNKTIQIKTANWSKKTENRKKPNFFRCVWMSFCENRRIRSDFGLIFQNRSKPHTYNLILIYLFINMNIYCINLFAYKKYDLIIFEGLKKSLETTNSHDRITKRV
jgi:hypothetical protein